MSTVTTAADRYADVVDALLKYDGVTVGSEGKKGFGSSALQSGGKIFAMFSQGSLVVKLPRSRVDVLVALGDGTRFDPRHDGRLMKEWFVVDPLSEQDWVVLAQQAMEFVTP